MDLVRLNIRGISYSQTQVGAYALILEEEFGDKKLPIIIGSFEAQAIAIALEKDIAPPRPLTHDLFLKMAQAFNIHIQSVSIYKLEDGVFFSKIHCLNDEGVEHEIDSRTSDAIALAVRFNAPIYALKSVLDKAGIQLEMISEEEEKQVQSALKEIEEEIITSEPQKVEEDWTEMSLNEIKKKLAEAIKNEDYELAARLRDEVEKRK